eukprot:12318483-Alexandrium_andersonii.AAC.1
MGIHGNPTGIQRECNRTPTGPVHGNQRESTGIHGNPTGLQAWGTMEFHGGRRGSAGIHMDSKGF